MNELEATFGKRLEKLAGEGRNRILNGGRTGVDFWSNDYLGLAREPLPGVTEFGSTGSRLISGDSAVLHETERYLADFYGFPAALLMPSGYTANTGLLSALGGRNDVFFYDEYIHASSIDGMRLSLSRRRKFRHNDAAHLSELLAKDTSSGIRYVLTEGRFSMDGDACDLETLREVCRAQNAWLIIDDAHSVGIDGDMGRGAAGSVSPAALREGSGSLVASTVVTFGKAPGYQGAVILGSESLKKLLVNTCRPLIFSTAPTEAFCRGVVAAHERMRRLFSERRARLQDVIDRYASLAPWPSHDGPIQLIPVGGAQEVMKVEAGLLTAGLLVKGIRSPTVAVGSERIRLCLHAFNTKEELDFLFRQLNNFL